ncbi:MAG: hypothetical protein WD770_04920 [Actinomycetota bacterium]
MSDDGVHSPLRGAVERLREHPHSQGADALRELESMGADAVEPLLEALSRGMLDELEMEAVEILGRIGDRRAAVPLIERVGAHPRFGEVGARAVRALGVSEPELEELMAADRTWQQRQGADWILDHWRRETATAAGEGGHRVELPVPVSGLRAILLVVVGGSELGPPPEDMVLETLASWNRALATGIAAERPNVRLGVATAETSEEGAGKLTGLLEGELSGCDLVIQSGAFQATAGSRAGSGHMMLGTFFRTPEARASRITNASFEELTLVSAPS